MKALALCLILLVGVEPAMAKNCTTGCACGNSCISCSDECHISGQGQVRLTEATPPTPPTLDTPPLVGDPSTMLLFAPTCPGYLDARQNPKNRAFTSEEPALALARGYKWAKQCSPAPPELAARTPLAFPRLRLLVKKSCLPEGIQETELVAIKNLQTLLRDGFTWVAGCSPDVEDLK